MSVKHYKIYCETDAQWERWFLDEGDVAPSTCPVDTAHAVTANSVAVVETIGPSDVKITNSPAVQVRKPSGVTFGRVYGFSPNFCDKSTWYHDSVEIVGEAVATGDGVATVFNLDRGSDNDPNERIIDLNHGKISEENNIANSRGEFRGYGNGYVLPSQGDPNASTAPLSGYVPTILVNAVEQTERAYGETTGGDYEINYATGEITFFVAPANTLAITATYWYAEVGTLASILVAPSTGKKYMIDRVEIQSTPDACPMTDIIMNVYVYGPAPGGFAAARPTLIKNVYDIVNWSYGARPQIPAQGAGNTRALPLGVNIHQVRYASEIPLLSSINMYMRVHLPTSVEFAGTWANIVLYGIEEDE